MKKILNWNHVSKKLGEEQLNELRSYYASYHRKCWAYKKSYKHKKMKIIGDSLSVIFASGGIASAVATSGISLVAISTTALLIQGYMKHKNLDLKIQNCLYAYQSYQHLLNAIRDTMRSGDFKPSCLHVTMNQIDNYVTDNSPVVDKFLMKYDNYFTIS